MRRRAAYLIAAGALILLGLVATLRVVGVVRDLRQVERLVDRATAALQEGDLGGATSDLEEAEGLVLDVNEALRSPEMSLVGWLPGVSQNLSSVRGSVEAMGALAHGGIRILRSARPFESPDGTLEVSLSDGSVSLDALDAVQQEITALGLDLTLRQAETPSSFLLLPQASEMQKRVTDEVASRRRQLETLRRGLELLGEVVGGNGPRRYLIAVANTAEMRGSGGMILNYGVLEGKDGTVDLTQFGRVDEVALAAALDSSIVPADYLARWSGFDPLLRWRQSNLAADFTIVAPVLEAMYEDATGLGVDGVIQIDPQGLAALLDGVGAVQVPELGRVDGDNVVPLVLHDAYVRFPGVEERSDVLGDVAEAAFRRLVDGEVPSLRTLARRLVEAVEGRHVLVHSRSLAIQREVVAFDADGALPLLPSVGRAGEDAPDSFAMTVQNLSGNKMDWYLETALDLTGSLPAGEIGTLDARVTLSNTAPPGVTTPKYIFGPGPGATPQPAGVERALVTLYLPVGSSLVGTTGDALVEPASSGTEGGRPYAAFIVDVPAGQQRVVDVSLELAPRPPGEYEMVVTPSPRVRPTSLRTSVDLGEEVLTTDLVLDRTWVLRTGQPPSKALAPVFR